ncbi:discoidin domain-containing protein [Methylomagnum ishizawai]|uniref:discoidin domain-containing protein n=1 Tax=Methylomagnum ishizawai TaxID=1760988 RepID=UPI001C32207A|nr:discoidin domain-containing protein [Methylomagnum ishizawai]BBL76999.1 hypothetical protein MishRS11D_40970 [Methylomagnum ishizawai]
MSASSLRCFLVLAALSLDTATGATPSNAAAEAAARLAPRGHYPKYFLGEQSYFTVVGAAAGDREGLLNEEGALEVDRTAFSIEPFLYTQDGLTTWNEAAPSPSLALGYLPVPSVAWRGRNIALDITAYATDGPQAALYARYRVENTGPDARRVKLWLALRPFQVNPPWQSLNLTGGVAPIHAIRREGPLIRVDARTVVALTPPDQFGTLAGDALVRTLAQGKLPRGGKVHDPKGQASAVLEYDLDLPPGAARDIYLAVPDLNPDAFANAAQVRSGRGGDFARAALQASLDGWQAQLSRVELLGPPAARGLLDAVRSNLAYLFVNRDGPALFPGSRTYARGWIRDSTVMASALLGMGYPDTVRRFLAWYAGFQYPDGKIPCCVDSHGADPTPENDSPGEFIHAVYEYQHYTHDLGLVRGLWPQLVKTVAYIEALRAQRLTPEYRTPDRQAFYGLLPESISHEGYSARPVHSFWDDFWALRGLDDAAELARRLDAPEAAHFAALRDAFRADVYAALKLTMARRNIGYLPGSVELGDFDSNATAMIVNLGRELPNLPQDALRQTFDEYWAYFQKRRAGQLDWDAYTPYEVRTVEALVRLGRRRQALAVLGFLMAGQRPKAWNHWAEVVWRDPTAPKFIGDMPHAWIGAEFVKAVRSLYVYERDSDQALVLAAGIPKDWLESESGVGVRRLPTGFGVLDYTLKRGGDGTLRLTLGGDLTVPPGKIVVRPPLDRPVRAVWINGRPSPAFTADAVTVGEWPAEVRIETGGP